jgi:hypothetical protein
VRFLSQNMNQGIYEALSTIGGQEQVASQQY